MIFRYRLIRTITIHAMKAHEVGLLSYRLIPSTDSISPLHHENNSKRAYAVSEYVMNCLQRLPVCDMFSGRLLLPAVIECGGSKARNSQNLCTARISPDQ